MSYSSSWRGRLVMFLALFLVPVVIVAQPNVASAAETVTRGPSVSATVDGFSLLSAIPGNDQVCTLTAQWVTPDAQSVLTPPFVQVGGVSCSQGNAFDNIGGADGSSMTVELQGEGCSGSVALPISYANGFDPSQATFPGGPVAVPSGCSIGEVCLTYETHGGGLASWFSHTYDTTCAAIGLGLPPEPPDDPLGGCDWYTPSTIALSGDNVGGWDYHRLTFAEPSTGSGVLRVLWHFSDGSTSAGTWSITPGLASLEIRHSSYTKTVAGIHLWRHHPQTSSPDWPSSTPNYNNMTSPPPAGVKGVTSPPNCAFWFGPKQYQDGFSAMDEPAGDLSGTPPRPPSADPVAVPAPPAADPTADACGDGFSFFKPSTWAGATSCAVVAALKAIWEVLTALGSAVAGLPGRIADAFGALFVPAPGFVADKVDTVQSRWDDTAPVVLVDEVAGLGDTFSIGSPGGCAGPPLNIDTEFTGSLSLNPLSACGPQVSVVANIVKIALTVIVYVGAGLGALRLLGSSLGLDLSIDKSGE